MPSFEELKKLRKPIENINVKHKESLTRLERFAVLITDHIGTAGFFVIISIWSVVWIFWNTFGPREARFDPFPAFVLWIFVSNIIQIFLLPLIMVSQNLQNRYDELRNKAEFELNLKSEREIDHILFHLEEQRKTISEILEKHKK